ncbi:MAG: type II toxin-antitoxin system RelE/ParE family toxin [Planctomycetota bacterium]|nr:MAG: type II toxin-antitoxin system RelE/ParE family toxin [Planctomycetota bacterium]
MIAGFACKETERLYQGQRARRWSEDLCRVARRKLAQLAVSTALNDLRVPPGNRLEVLKGERKGQHSIRINSQWRLCFIWKHDSAHDVEIVDYH